MTNTTTQQTRIEQIAHNAAARRRDAKTTPSAPKDRMPWSFVIGLVLFVLGVLSASNNGGPIAAIGIVLGFVGLVAGAVQYGVAKGRRSA